MGSRYPLRLSKNIGNNTLKQAENLKCRKKFSEFRGRVRVAGQRSTLTGVLRFAPPPHRGGKRCEQPEILYPLPNFAGSKIGRADGPAARRHRDLTRPHAWWRWRISRK
jgi:hypothetical protein